MKVFVSCFQWILGWEQFDDGFLIKIIWQLCSNEQEEWQSRREDYTIIEEHRWLRNKWDFQELWENSRGLSDRINVGDDILSKGKKYDPDSRTSTCEHSH